LQIHELSVIQGNKQFSLTSIGHPSQTEITNTMEKLVDSSKFNL